MQLFYTPDIATGYCTLDAEESRHAVRVLRMRTGDELMATDGRGAMYRCRVVEPNDRACMVEVVECTRAEEPNEGRRPRLHLLVAPTKNPARMEWLVEKAVEVGVYKITMLQCDHSERVYMKADRLERVAVSAMKQSLHTRLPHISQPVSLREWLSTDVVEGKDELRLIAHCETGKPRVPIAEALQPRRDVAVLIGPEGDFSPEEVILATERGFVPVSLGRARLRTETAALYATVAFNLINDYPI